MTHLPWIIVAGATLALAALFLGLFGQQLLALFGFEISRIGKARTAHEELRGTLEELHREGAVVKADRDRVGGLLDLAELEVSDIMVHRTSMRMVDADMPAAALVAEVLQSPNTRMPIWRGSNDNIIGFVHAKALLRELHDLGNDYSKFDISNVMTKPWFVPDTTNLQDQLSAFLRRKAHIAIVVDEYGEVQGLVTLEDIIEEIVGDIADEHDIDLQGVRQQQDGSVIVDGSVPIRDLNRALDWTLPDEEATTVAGLVIHESMSIPDEKQAFTFHGKRFTVLKREKNRIVRLRVKAIQ
ncbi:MAG: transporter associated domain-containing protein [Mesorhizobium sp.]